MTWLYLSSHFRFLIFFQLLKSSGSSCKIPRRGKVPEGYWSSNSPQNALHFVITGGTNRLKHRYIWRFNPAAPPASSGLHYSFLIRFFSGTNNARSLPVSKRASFCASKSAIRSSFFKAGRRSRRVPERRSIPGAKWRGHAAKCHEVVPANPDDKVPRSGKSLRDMHTLWLFSKFDPPNNYYRLPKYDLRITINRSP
jgi:hypothetical protein